MTGSSPREGNRPLSSKYYNRDTEKNHPSITQRYQAPLWNSSCHRGDDAETCPGEEVSVSHLPHPEKGKRSQGKIGPDKYKDARVKPPSGRRRRLTRE